MRNAYFLPFSRRLDIEYPAANGREGRRHIIINCFTPIDDGNMELCQWLFRNDTEADCPAQMLIDFDAEITREDKDILESTNPDALVDLRRRGVEYSMDFDRPGILIRLSAHAKPWPKNARAPKPQHRSCCAFAAKSPCTDRGCHGCALSSII